MLKVLRVGDPHVTPDALEDSQALLDLVLKTAVEHSVKRIEFLGDQYHTHSLINVYVLDFWKRNFKKLIEAGFEVLCLVGNHDQPGDGASISSMLAHPDIIVVDKPTMMASEGILYMPYMTSEEVFKKNALEGARNGSRILVCHQSFFGSIYENGFPCLDGFTTNDIHQQLIISGHIHRPQEIWNETQKLWYIGAPRWRTLADANTDRSIWVMEHDGNGFLVSSIPIDTGRVCKQIFHYEDRPETPLLLRPVAEHSYIIDIHGPQSFIDERKKLWSFARVRTFNTEVKTIRVRESEGVAVAWDRYINEFAAPLGTPSEQLKKVAFERLKI